MEYRSPLINSSNNNKNKGDKSMPEIGGIIPLIFDNRGSYKLEPNLIIC